MAGKLPHWVKNVNEKENGKPSVSNNVAQKCLRPGMIVNGGDTSWSHLVLGNTDSFGTVSLFRKRFN